MADLLQFSGLLQTTSSSFLRRSDELLLAINCHGDEIGSLTSRLGYSQYGGDLSAGNSILGGQSYAQLSTGNTFLFEFVNGALMYKPAGAWSTIQSGLLSDAQAEFAVFLDQLYMVGKNSSGTALTTAVITGTTYSTSGNVANATTGQDVEIYRDRVYIANNSQINFSSLPDAAGTTITWTTTDNFIVETRDGEDIEGIHNNEAIGKLLIFKQSSLHAYDTFRRIQVASVGTTAKRSIATVGGITFFHNKKKKKIFAYDGARELDVSRKIRKWVEGIQSPDNVFAISQDDEFYKLNVGTVIVDGVTYTKCEFRYSLPDNTWTIYRYYDTFTNYVIHSVSGVERVYGGTSDGQVHALAITGDTVYADDGQDIASEFMFETDLGLPSERKKIDKALIYTTSAQTLTGRVRVRNRDWFSHFGINEDEQEININSEDGRFLQFHFSSNSQVSPWKFEGLTFVPKLTTLRHG